MAHASMGITTKLVDLASVSLHDIRSTHTHLLDHAVLQLTTAIRTGGNVESIQSQRD